MAAVGARRALEEEFEEGVKIAEDMDEEHSWTIIAANFLFLMVVCIMIDKWRKRREFRRYEERFGTENLMSKPLSERGFIKSDVPGMEGRLIDLDLVADGVNIADMVLSRGGGRGDSGRSSSPIFQGQVVDVHNRGHEAGVMYVDSVPVTPSASTILDGQYTALATALASF